MRKEIDIWFRQSEKDLESAEKNFSIEEYHLVVFLCQQSLEKGLKAYFIFKKNKSPDFTHSLIYLASETGVPKKFFSFLREITPAFVNTRYPDAAYGITSDLYDEEIASEYFEKTKEVIEWLRLKIRM